jgi:hypothetical protein
MCYNPVYGKIAINQDNSVHNIKDWIRGINQLFRLATGGKSPRCSLNYPKGSWGGRVQ